MNIQGLTIDKERDVQKENPADYAYGLVTEMSRVALLCGEELKNYVIGEELLEARFFDEKKELHIWKTDGRFEAVLVAETDEVNPIIKQYPVTGTVNADGKWLCTAQYLAFDADGQAYIALTRLCGVKEREA